MKTYDDDQMKAAVNAGQLAAWHEVTSRGANYYDERMRMVVEVAVRKALTDPDPERFQFAVAAVETDMKDHLARHGNSWASAQAAQKGLEGPKQMAIGCGALLGLFLVIVFPPLLLLAIPLLLVYAYKLGSKGG